MWYKISHAGMQAKLCKRTSKTTKSQAGLVQLSLFLKLYCVTSSQHGWFDWDIVQRLLTSGPIGYNKNIQSEIHVRYWTWHRDVKTVTWQPNFFTSISYQFPKVQGSARIPLASRSSAATVPLKFPAKCVCNRPSNTCLANPRWTNKTQDWTCMTSNNKVPY